jgi:hypothetical protein
LRVLWRILGFTVCIRKRKHVRPKRKATRRREGRREDIVIGCQDTMETVTNDGVVRDMGLLMVVMGTDGDTVVVALQTEKRNLDGGIALGQDKNWVIEVSIMTEITEIRTSSSSGVIDLVQAKGHSKTEADT